MLPKLYTKTKNVEVKVKNSSKNNITLKDFHARFKKY